MTALRQSVPGETLAMLIGAYGLFATAAWLSIALHEPLGLALSACSFWIAMRSVGFRSGQIATPIVTAIALVGAVLLATHDLQAVPKWLSSGVFSARCLAAALAFAATVDLVDLLYARGLTLGGVLRQVTATIPWHTPRFWGVLFLALFVIYMIVVPAAGLVIEQFTPPPEGVRELPDMTWGDHVRLRTAEAFVACMFLAVGANVGSFINVVVYRAPRGLSVVVHSSRCPKCGSKIAARDNIPVIGWLKLGGRCRSCDLPISARYPLVEGLTGTLFLLFYFVELLSGGINLPERTPNGYAGVVWIIFYTKWDLVGYYVYHMFLLTTLLTWALIRYDGHSIPRRLQVVAFTVSAAAVTAWPSLPLVASGATLFPGRPALLSAWVTSVIGAAIGVTLGKLIVKLTATRAHGAAQSCSALPAALALAGFVLGWQATCSIAVLTVGFAICQHYWWDRLQVRRLPQTLEFALFAAAVVHQLTWSWIVTYLSPWWPAREFSFSAMFTCVACLSVMLFTLRRFNLTSPR